MNTFCSACEYLEKHGIKPSLQSIAIAEYLMENRTHPTADEIYNALSVSVPTLSKTTVYNTLRLFAEQNAVLSLVIDEKNVRFDIDTSCHAHFQCCRCGKLYDIPIENPDLFEPSRSRDFFITETHLYYRGYCKECRNKTMG